MTDIDRILRQILHDPWTSRVFLAFTVGMFLSCSAEFAAGQDTTAPSTRAAAISITPAPTGTTVLP